MEGCMEQCERCENELRLRPGIIVELPSAWVGSTRAGLAVVVRQAFYNTWHVVMITGPRKGETDVFGGAGLRVVHGYIHIDRDGLRRADTRYPACDSCDHNY